MIETNIEQYIEKFLENRNPSDRYASFDYCFNYFQGFKNKQDIIAPENIEKSCLHLWFYLASWGMYRGSSFLLQRSIKIYENLLKVIVDMDEKIWNMDVDKYPWNEDFILECYNKIKNSLIHDNERHVVLVTKIMLGVFGCIPAYDQYFTKWFKNIFEGDCGFTTVNKESLSLIYKFYQENKDIIDTYAHKTKTLCFDSKEVGKSYTKAKIIDMIGFVHWWNL